MSVNPENSLTEFLLARIAEDESAAHAAARDVALGPISSEDVEWRVWHADYEGIGVIGDYASYDQATHETTPTTVHMERWDPARVLAECETKRRIIEWASEEPGRVGPALSMLSLPYADHPDYRSEWAPEVEG